MRYRINTPQVSSETIDGETIIIDFISGAYFSTDKLGAVIWENIKAGLPIEQIQDDITTHYAQHQEAAQTFMTFMDRLLSENLVLVDTTNELPPPAACSAQLVYPDIFVAPVLEKYTDMQDLLLLDPIHETDEQGWPMRKQPASQ